MTDVSTRFPAARPVTGRRRRLPGGSWLRRLPFIALVIALAVIFMYPFVWLVSASLKPRESVFDNKLIPETFHPQNYSEVWHAGQVGTWLMNSAYISFLAATAVTISSAIVAFGFAYFRFPGRNFLFGLVLASMMLPTAVTLIPVFLIWNHLHLVNTQYPLWMMNLFGSAFYIFLLRQFFLGIPRELFEAARVDGDNYWTMFWRIAFPLAKPALIVTFIFELQASWNDLLKPLIYLQDPNLYTMPRGLKAILDSFGQSGEMQWEIIIAAMVITTVPMIIVFFLGQRYFVEGIAASGRKG